MHLNNQKGFSLIEVLISLAILALLGVAFLTALSGASKILLKTDTSETARDLAVAQMERLKSEPYNLRTYNVDSSLFTATNGYSANISVNSVKPDGSLQKITITVFQGTVATPAYVLTNYKAR
jgi:prepilin-type N-terminal cleavage/methylation domain-containing protein